MEIGIETKPYEEFTYLSILPVFQRMLQKPMILYGRLPIECSLDR